MHQPSSPTPDPRRRSLKTPLPGRKWAAALGGHVFTCQGGTGSLICCWLLALPLLSSFSGLFLFLPAPLSLAPLCPTGPQARKQSQQRPRAERRTLTRLSDCAGAGIYIYIYTYMMHTPTRSHTRPFFLNLFLTYCWPLLMLSPLSIYLSLRSIR